MVRKKIKRGLRVSRYFIYKETLIDRTEHCWSFLGAFIGIGLIGFFQSHLLTKDENIFLIGSFGASSVLIYGAIQSPLAQPRNLVGGHVISAFIGVSIYKLLPDIIWLTAPLAVALSIVAMQVTKTLHPPGGRYCADCRYWLRKNKGFGIPVHSVSCSNGSPDAARGSTGVQ